MVENQASWRQRYRDRDTQPTEPESTGDAKAQTLAEQLGIKIQQLKLPEQADLPVRDEPGTADAVKIAVASPAAPSPEDVAPLAEPVADEDTAEGPTVDPLTGLPLGG